MRTFKWIPIIAALTGVVHAQTVEEQMAVIDAKIQIVKKQKELDEALRASVGAGASAMPSIVSIAVGANRVVRLQLPNGLIGHFREGDSIRPGMSVNSITAREVHVLVASGAKAAVVPLDYAAPSGHGVNGAGSQVAHAPSALLPAEPTVIVPKVEVLPPAATQSAPANRPASAIPVVPIPRQQANASPVIASK